MNLSVPCHVGQNYRVVVVGGIAPARRKNRRVEIRIVLVASAVVQGLYLPRLQSANTIVESISVGGEEMLLGGGIPASVFDSGSTMAEVLSGTRLRAGPAGALVVRLRRLPIGPALRLAIRRPGPLSPPRATLAEVRRGAGRRRPMVASALLVVAAVAAAAVPAAVAVVTVASLRFARWSATALDADGEPKAPPRPRDTDADVTDIEGHGALGKCPLCDRAMSYKGDGKSRLSGAFARENLHGKTEPQRLAFVSQQVRENIYGPCGGLAVARGLWQACATCGAEWIVVAPDDDDDDDDDETASTDQPAPSSPPPPTSAIPRP